MERGTILGHLVSVLFITHMVLAKQELLKSTRYANNQLTNIQFHNDRIYLADQGNIYEVNEHLETLTSAVTCQDKTAECNSVNKILLVNNATNELVTCGTGNGGICELRNLSNINLVTRISSGENSLNVSSDPNRPAQAVLMADGKMMIGITFGNGLDENNSSNVSDAITYEYALSTRILTDGTFLASQILTSVIKLDGQVSSLEDYLIYFRKGFQQDGFSYFITNQKTFVGDSRHVSKLIRICQNDTSTNYNSYADIEISCTKDGTTYNLIQDAIIIDSPATTETIFVAAFTSGNDPESVSGDSAICVTRLRDLDMAIMEAKKEFVVCPGSNYTATQRYLPNNIGPCINESLYYLSVGTCDTAYETFTYAIGETPYTMVAAYTLPVDKGYITKLYGNVVDGDKVDIHAGTSRGNIIKLNFLDISKPLEQYEENYVRPGFSVRAMHQKGNNYYVMTSRKLLKYNNTDCSEYTTCAVTMAGRNPLCGWCIYKQRSTRKSECSSEANHWLSSLGQCVSLSLDTKGFPINTGRIQVHVNVGNYSAEQVGDKYTCIYKNGAAEIGSVDASSNGNYLTCNSTIVTSHTKATLELWVNGVMLATTPFLFYDCGHYNKCGECTSTIGSDCQWCLQNSKCVSPGQCSNGAGGNITEKPQCPQLLDNNDIHFVPNGVETDVIFQAKNLPTVANPRYYCTIPDITNFQPVEASKENKDSPVTFKLKINITADVGKRRYPVIIKYGTQNSDLSTSVEFDDDYSSSVTVYNCEKLASDCGRCKTLNKTRYKCDLCETGVCGYSGSQCNITDTCPAPVITKIVPMDGPWQGCTRVTISGTNLGLDKSYSNKVTLADTPCTVIEVVPDPDSHDFERPMTKEIVCQAGKQTNTSAIGIQGDVIVAWKKSSASSNVTFTYQNITIRGIYPTSGPLAGGTRVTLSGENLGVGNRHMDVYFGNTRIQNAEVLPKLGPDANLTSVNFTVQFVVPSGILRNVTRVSLFVHGNIVAIGKLNYSLLPNPVIDPISPKKAIKSGGTPMRISGRLLKNANAATVTVEYAGLTTNATCDIISASGVICPTPKAPTNLEIGGSNERKRRKKRAADCGCACECEITTVKIALDGVEASFTFRYYKDPTLNKLDDELLFESTERRLTINGTNLNFVATKDDINVTVGIETCTIIELTATSLTCLAPKDQPASGMGSSLPEVNVTIGNIHETVFYLRYKDQFKEKTTNIAIISAAVLGSLLAIGVIVGVVFYKKYRQIGMKARDFAKSLIEMELEIKNVALEEFLDMHVSMSGVSKNLVEHGFPYHSYQQYAFFVMFPMEFMDNHPLLHEPVVSDESRMKMKKGMEMLEQLIYNKFFLSSVISTMEKQKKFFLKEKSNMAGNLCSILLGKMDYLNEILYMLLTNLARESAGKKTQKTLFRRYESITEKLLSNWLYLCLYPHFKANSGSPLYILFKATQFTIEAGPIDVITNDTKYTLSEEKLLKKWNNATEEGAKDVKFEAKVLTLNVIVDNGKHIFRCKVLDCDTITQVKEKCLNQIYVNYPASDMKVEAADLDLEWHEGFGGILNLKDEDNTSKREGEWIRLNTLAHYSVKDESNMALVDPNGAGIAQHEEYANLSQIRMDSIQGCTGSMDSTEPVTPPNDNENPLQLKQWHLIKKKEDEMPKTQRTAIDELYLNRLFTTKQSIREYMRPLFDIILDKDHCPPPIKHLYDFLDVLGENNKVDADTIHAWKSHSYVIRVWASLLQRPSMLFDVNAPCYVDTSMDVISQVFIDSCSLTMQKYTKDSSPHKLIFKNEMLHYQEKVKEFYKNVKVNTARHDELGQYLSDLNKQQLQNTNFNRFSALYRFYQQLEPYMDDIVDDLSMNKETSSLQLDKKLENIVSALEDEV